MDATTVGVDLAKHVFEMAVSDGSGHIVERHRLSRTRFEQFFSNRTRCRIVMEACGSAHHHARRLHDAGHEVILLPAQYVRAYVRRSKTDAADAAALIEASRCSEIRPVPIKGVEQQAVQQLHRLRSQWMQARTARVNFLRGSLREFGIAVPLGVARAIQAVRAAIADPACPLPALLHASLLEVLGEIGALEQRCRDVERELSRINAQDPIIERLLQIPGVGPLTATALRASVVDVQRFPSGRHFASWLGLTAREHSSGQRRRLGRISKQGDPYLRTLLIHGARAVLNAARGAKIRGKPLDHLRAWALQTQERVSHNKAAVALANKLARILWATWRYERSFTATTPSAKPLHLTNSGRSHRSCSAQRPSTRISRKQFWLPKPIAVIGSASASLMMSRAATPAHQQDGYTTAAALRTHEHNEQIRLLALGVHTRFVRLL